MPDGAAIESRCQRASLRPGGHSWSQRIFGGRDDLTFCDEAFAAPEGVDALVLVTGWKQFRSPDVGKIRQAVKDEVVFDGRDLYDRQEIDAAGLAYYAIGRGRSLHA
ncbi:UDPglucose 6-dehydrogenase [Xanthomonas arboricola]|uniref:UDP-glucose 6-dehydrogenase n=1 Tax=Xanthomonas cannabis TaxID=1885674 RepID=A0ABR6JQ10_9XANT|nr:UDPglucose 6-dehydrogenase [Xanthomonas cannabis]MBB5523727.1 UDPglucose 6-dehydrogenase [Xanthomonas cannabis]